MGHSEKPEHGLERFPSARNEPAGAEVPAHQGGLRPRPDERLDTVGFFCPIPIIKTSARIRGMGEGKILELISDDRVVLVDLPNWCRGAGHEFLGHFEENGEIHLFVRKCARKSRSSSEG